MTATAPPSQNPSSVTKPTLVAAGLPALAGELEATGRFAAVHHVDTLGGFRALVTSVLAHLGGSDVVFAFADDVPEDGAGISFDRLLTQMVSSGWRVVIIGGLHGRDLVARHPGIGLLETPVTVNLVLGAFSSFPGIDLMPVEDNAAPPPSTPAAPASPFATTDTPSPSTFGLLSPSETSPSAGEPATSSPVDSPAVVPAVQPETTVTAPSSPFAGRADDQSPRTSLFAPITTPSPATPTVGLRPPSSGLRPPSSRPAVSAGDSSPFADTPIQPRGAAGLRVTEETVRRRGYVIMVGAPKGGTGKSTLSLTLAVALGMRLKAAGRTVALIDANIQQADAGSYLGAHSAPTVMTLARDQSLITPEQVTQGLYHRRDLNLSLLLGANSSIEANPAYLNSDLYRRILEAMRFSYDYIVIDTPVSERYLDIVSEFAIPCADFIVVPAIPAFQTLVNINRWLTETVSAPHSAGGLGVPHQKIGVVLNRAEEDISCGEDEVKNELGSWNFLGSIPESKEWKRANNEHRLIVLENLHDLNEALIHILNQATGHVEPLLSTPVLEAPKVGRLNQLKRILSRGW